MVLSTLIWMLQHQNVAMSFQGSDQVTYAVRSRPVTSVAGRPGYLAEGTANVRIIRMGLSQAIPKCSSIYKLVADIQTCVQARPGNECSVDSRLDSLAELVDEFSGKTSYGHRNRIPEEANSMSRNLIAKAFE
jgi:hypothetical protein